MKRISKLFAALLLCTAVAAPVAAQSYPNRSIRVIVPFGPGGGTDILMRLVGQKMQESMGQPIVIDNRPGANTLIGAEALARAAPDGYTLMVTLDMTMTMNPSLYSKLPYHPEKDFAAVGMIVKTPVVFLTHSKFPFQTLKEFLDYARANPGKITYGAGAIISQVVGEQLVRAASINMVYTNYKGGGQAVQGMLGGDIQFGIMDIASVAPHLRDGKLRALAVSGEKRETTMPNVPTIREAGYPELEYRDWWGMYAPAATPRPIIDRLNAEIGRAVASPDLRPKLADLSFDPAHSSPEAMLAQQRADAQKWDKVIKAAGLKLD